MKNIKKIKLDCIFVKGEMDDDKKAVLISDGGPKPQWIPKSQIFEHERNEYGEGHIVMPVWLAEKVGFV